MAFSPLYTAFASNPAWLRIMASVFAITCSSSATRTLDLGKEVAPDSGMLSFPKRLFRRSSDGSMDLVDRGKHRAIIEQLALSLCPNDTLTAGYQVIDRS